MENLALQAFAIAFGACIGSFLNVVIYRLPAGKSLLKPASHCPKCKRALAPRDNIPILGWFLIGGKCRYCRTPVSWRYPAIEVITAGLFWFAALRFPMTEPLTVLLGGWAFLSWLLALAAIDLDTMTLPNPLTTTGLLLGLMFQVVGGHAIAGITGAVLGIWLLDIIRLGGRLLLNKEAMGAGDAKLAAMMGAWLGWQGLLLAILLAATLGTVAGLAAILLGKLVFRQRFPFGPFLATGGMLSLFFGKGILGAYLAWFGLA